MVQQDPMWTKRIQRGLTGSNVVQGAPTGSKSIQHDPTGSSVVQRGPTGLNVVQRCPTGSNVIQHDPTLIPKTTTSLYHQISNNKVKKKEPTLGPLKFLFLLFLHRAALLLQLNTEVFFGSEK